MDISFRLENFKAFEDSGSIHLPLITVLCGENSSGKSSIIKSLLLLRQSSTERRATLLSNTPPQPLLFNGEITRLGSWLDTVYGQERAREIRLTWKMAGKTNEIPQRLIARGYVMPRPVEAEVPFNYELSITLRSEQRSTVELGTSLAYLKLVSGDGFELHFSAEGEDFYQVKISNIGAFLRRPHAYALVHDSASGEIIKFLNQSQFGLRTGRIKLQLNGPFPTGLRPSIDDSWIEMVEQIRDAIEDSRKTTRGARPKYLGQLTEEIEQVRLLPREEIQKKSSRRRLSLFESIANILSYEIDSALNSAVNVVSPLWRNLRYVGPLREQPRRYYQFDDTGGVDIGYSGEFTTQVLALERENLIFTSQIQYNQSGKIDSFVQVNETLLQSTNYWLGQMDLPKVKPEILHQSLYQLRVGGGDSISVSLPDVGFGVSQILPVIVEALRAKSGDTVILEQPEIHLHPRIQAALADFIIARAQDGVRFIVESHSEYMIKRLCRRVAENSPSNIRDIVNIIFVSRGQNESSKCESVKLNEFGEIENWPIGFFDTSEDLYWAEASLKSRRKVRSEKI